MTAPTVACCGAGWVMRVHAAACAALGWPIVAVASRTAARAASLAADVGARSVGYDELPAGADVVIVGTPPSYHASHAAAALAAGALVVVDKPLCTTLADADHLVALSASDPTRLLYAENLAAAPVVGALLARVELLGPLTHLQVRSRQGLPTWGEFTTDSWGGGALFDLGVHPLAIALMVARLAGAGAPQSVSATLAGGDGHRTDEEAQVSITFASGLVARVEASWRDGPTPRWDVQAASATGVLRAELLPTQELEHNGSPVAIARPAASPPELEALGYIGQLRGFLADRDTGRAPVGAEFGRAVLDVTCAAYRSAGTGAPEPLPFTGRRDLTPLQLWHGA
jgi:predicted dehydrogenase